MLRRWIALLMCLALVCSMLPVSALAEDTLPEVTEAPETTEVTEATEVTETTEVTEATEATEATEVTEATEATEATEVTEATEATEEGNTEPTLLPPSYLSEEEPTAEEALRSALEAAGNWETVTLSEDLTLSADLTVPAQVTLEPTSTLTVPSGVTLTLNGSLLLDSGRLVLEDGSALVIGDEGSLRAVYDTVVTMGNNVTLSLGTGRVFLDNGITGLDGIPKEVCVRFVVPSSEAALQEAIQISGDYFHTNVNITNWAGLTAISGAVTIPQNMDVNLSMWGGETMSLTLQSGSALTVNGIFNTYSDTVLTVEDGASITVNAGGSMTVSEGATLVNHGTVTHGGNLIINGTLEGNAPVTSGPSNGDTVTTPEELLSAIAQAEQTETWTNIHVAADLVVPENVALGSNPERPFCHLILDSGYTVTIRSGATLTVNTLVDVNGTLLVEDGGSLLNQCSLFVNSRGRLEVASGGTYDGTGMLSGTLDCISGVDGSRVVYQGYVSTEQDLRSALAVTGYGAIEVYPQGTITLTQDLTVPEGRVSVFLHPGSSLVVPDGITLVNQGGIYLFTESALCIQAGGTIDNQGYLGVNAENGLVCEGTYLGNAPDTGEEMSGISVTTLDDLKAAIAQAEQAETQMNILLSADLDISEDLEFGGNAMYEIAPEKTLTVKSGVTLTVSSMLFVDGSLHVEAGATLVNSNQIILGNQNGALSVSGTYIHQGLLVGTLEQITGVDGAQVTRTLNVFSEEGLRDGAAITGYHSVDLILSEDITLTQDLTIPEGVSVHVCNDKTLTVPSGVTLLNENFISIYGGGTLWIQVGGTLNNQGRIYQEEDGTLTRDGTYTGNEPNASDPGGSDMNVNVTTLDDLKDAIAQATAGTQMDIHISADFDISEDLEFGGNAWYYVDSGCTLTVKSGVTLTVSAYAGILGTLLVEQGAGLVNQGQIYADNPDSRLVMEGTYTHEGILIASTDTVTGIPASQITHTVTVTTEAALLEAAAITGYQEVNILIFGSSITLSQDVTIPTRSTLQLIDGASLTIAENATLVNEGTLFINSGTTLWIQEGGALDNQRTIFLREGGTLTRDGAFTGNEPNSSGSEINRIEVTSLQGLKDAITQAEQAEDWMDFGIVGTFDITEDLTLSGNASYFIDNGSALTVCSGSTLTVDNWLGISGSLLVASGAGLRNNGGIGVYEGGSLTVEEGGSYTGKGDLSGTLDRISGIYPQYITYEVDVYAEEDLRQALCVTGYGAVAANIFESIITLTDDLTVPEGVRLSLYSGAKLVISDGVTLVNRGTLNVWNDSQIWIQAGGTLDNKRMIHTSDPDTWLLNEGTFTGNQPGEGPSFGIFVSTLDELEAALEELKDQPPYAKPVYVQADIVLENDLQIGDFYMGIAEGATVTVPSGVTMTVSGNLGVEGSLLVSGKLENQGYVEVFEHGRLEICSGGAYTGDGAIDGSKENVIGISASKLSTTITVYTVEELNQVLATASEYRQREIICLFDGEAVLNRDLSIRSNDTVYIDGVLVIPEGITVKVDGFLRGNLRIMSGATLTVRGEGIVSILDQNSSMAESDANLNVVPGSILVNSFEEIPGIPRNLISLTVVVESQEQLEEAYALASEYAAVWAEIWDITLTLTGDLIIPANGNLTLYGNMNIPVDAILEVPEGITLTNLGSIYLYDRTVLRICRGGSLVNQGDLVLGGGTLENLGSYTEGTVTGGSCGEKLTWSLDEATGVLTIDGSGAMDGYAQEGAPWYGLREQITRIAMKQGSNIGANAFYGLTQVTEITLPRTLESFRDAFGTCTSLTRISFPDGNDHGFSTNAEGTMVLYSLPISAAAAYAMSRSDSGSAVCAVVPGAQGKLVIPEGVTTLAAGAMSGCANITEVSFPQGFQAIEAGAMTGCSGIEKLVFPETLEAIGANAFSGCANLTQLVFTGPAPAELSPDALADVEATVSYPANEESWQETVLPEGITVEAKSVMIRITGADTLLAGNSTQLTASFLPEDSGTELVWSLEKGEDDASISQDGTLTAKEVTRRTQVTVLASAADGSAEPGSFTVTIVPLASGVEIARDFAEVTGQTLVVNLNEPQQDILLTARTVPEGCGSEVSWKVSDTKDAYGSYDIQGNSLTFAPGGKTGSVTFTATAADGSGETAKVIVKLVRYADRLEIQKAPEYILGGKSVTLTTDVASDKTLTDKKVVWSLDEESAPYASISASGKLTTKVVSERVTLYVTATLAADPSVSDTVAIRLYPAATAVELRSDDRVFAEGEKITWDVGQGTLNLDATSYPVDAMQDGTWSVSSKSIAEITQDGQVTFLKAGKVKITFTASDGSGKKATLNVTVTKKVADLTIEEPAEPVRAGKTLTLKATAWAADETPATNQKFTWSLPGVPSSIATISSSGKVTVKDVSNQQLITVRVQSKENPEICAVTEITLLPKYEKTLQLTVGEANLTGATLSREPGSEALQIVPKLYLTEGGRESGLEELDSSACTFSSSNKRVATIDAQGRITFVGVGNTTISAKYTAEIDGKSVVLTAKFSLNVAYRVHSVKIAEPADTNLRSGKSLTLKASALREDGTLATSQKMIWLSSNPDVATVSASGKVTAKNVTKNTQVTIKAASQESIYDEITLTIRPKSAYQMSLFRQGVAAPAKQTVPMDLCPIVLKDEMKALMYVSDPASDKDGQQLEVQEAAWTSSNKKVAEFDEAGNLLFKQPGSTNITASCVVNVNGRDTTVSAKVAVKVVRSVRSLTVSKKVEGQALVSGKKLQLVAAVNSDASNKKVTWTSSDPAVAKVSSSGLVTAGRVFEQQTVTITAKAQDGYGAEDSIELTVYPAATTVSILSGGQVLDNRTITVSLADLNSMKLSAVVYPDVSTGALQQVTWSSSNTRAASFDGSTLNLHRTGTVTIKATANDGSKKTVSFKLVITD